MHQSSENIFRILLCFKTVIDGRFLYTHITISHESSPAGLKHCWAREVANTLYWSMDGGKGGGGCSYEIRLTGGADTNPSGLPHCDKALPGGAKPLSWVENLAVKVCHEDVHIPESDHWRSPEQLTGSKAAKIQVSQVDLNWQYNGKLFLDQLDHGPEAHDTSGHQERDATQWWASYWRVDLTMDTIPHYTWNVKHVLQLAKC